MATSRITSTPISKKTENASRVNSECVVRNRYECFGYRTAVMPAMNSKDIVEIYRLWQKAKEINDTTPDSSRLFMQSKHSCGKTLASMYDSWQRKCERVLRDRENKEKKLVELDEKLTRFRDQLKSGDKEEGFILESIAGVLKYQALLQPMTDAFKLRKLSSQDEVKDDIEKLMSYLGKIEQVKLMMHAIHEREKKIDDAVRRKLEIIKFEILGSDVEFESIVWTPPDPVYEYKGEVSKECTYTLAAMG